MTKQNQTKEYYVSMEQEKLKEIEKLRKRIRGYSTHIFHNQSRLSNAQSNASRKESDARGAEAKAATLAASAAAAQAEANRLANSSSPADKARARLLYAEAAALASSAGAAKMQASGLKREADLMRFDTGSIRSEISFDERYKKQDEDMIKKLEKEAKEFRNLAMKA